MIETNDGNEHTKAKPVSKGLLITLGCVVLYAVVYLGHMLLGGSTLSDSSKVSVPVPSAHKVYVQSPKVVAPTQPNPQVVDSGGDKKTTKSTAPKSQVDATLSEYSQLTKQLNLLNMKNQISTSKLKLAKSDLELASLMPHPIVVTNNASTKKSAKSAPHAGMTLSVGMIYKTNDHMHALLSTQDGKVNVVAGSVWGDGKYTVTDINSSCVTYSYDNQSKKLCINPLNLAELS